MKMTSITKLFSFFHIYNYKNVMEQKVIELHEDTKLGLRNPSIIYTNLSGYVITLKKVKDILNNLAELQINKEKVKI
jgi:hypothetical protein